MLSPVSPVTFNLRSACLSLLFLKVAFVLAAKRTVFCSPGCKVASFFSAPPSGVAHTSTGTVLMFFTVALKEPCSPSPSSNALLGRIVVCEVRAQELSRNDASRRHNKFFIFVLFPQIWGQARPAVAANDDLRPEKRVSKKENRLKSCLSRFFVQEKAIYGLVFI